MAYEYMLVISLYRVIGGIRMMTLHLGSVNGGSDMVGRTWDHVHDMMVMVRCPGDLGGGTVAQKTVSMFPDLNIIAL